MEMIIGDLLSLYPFLHPQDGDIILLPVNINGSWSLSGHTVDRIVLTPNFMGSPIVAIGLYPSDVLAPPRLLFKGTTYFTDDGAAFGSIERFNRS